MVIMARNLLVYGCEWNLVCCVCYVYIRVLSEGFFFIIEVLGVFVIDD